MTTIVAMARSTSGEDESAREVEQAPNPVWFKPIMLGLMIIGLVWVIVFYLSGSNLPIPGIGAWNLVIGFGVAFVGFLMTTRWR
ncbi:septation inhibitor protein [Microbacterium sp. No. 7]|nr:septation inhibitor protein [Microbacterium sp. No. 7]